MSREKKFTQLKQELSYKEKEITALRTTLSTKERELEDRASHWAKEREEGQLLLKTGESKLAELRDELKREQELHKKTKRKGGGTQSVLEEKISHLQEQLKNATSRLSLEQKQIVRQLESKTKALQSYADDKRRMKRELGQAARRFEAVKSEKDRLSSEVARITSKFTSLMEETKILKVKVRTTASMNKRLIATQKGGAKAEIEFNKLEDICRRLQFDLTRAKSKSDRLQLDLAEKESQLNKANDRILDMRDLVTNAERDVVRSRREIRDLIKRNSRLSWSKERERNDFVQHQKKKSELSREIRNLKDVVRSLKVEMRRRPTFDELNVKSPKNRS